MPKYRNQQDYEYAKENDQCKPACNTIKPPSPPQNSFDCKLNCNGTQVSFKISDKSKSFTVTQTKE